MDTLPTEAARIRPLHIPRPIRPKPITELPNRLQNQPPNRLRNMSQSRHRTTPTKRLPPIPNTTTIMTIITTTTIIITTTMITGTTNGWMARLSEAQ